MELLRLRVFARVVDSGSITRTARSLNTTQSAISRQISALESELGGPLFYRNGRGVVPTDFGQRVAGRVRAVLAALDQISAEASAEAGIPSGDVAIGLLPTIGSAIAAHLHREVHRRFPKVRLRIISGFSRQLDADLADGDIDMALLLRHAIERGADDQKIAVLHSYLVGSPGDPVTAAPTVDFAGLRHLPLVLPLQPDSLRLALDDVAAHLKVELFVAVEASSVPIQLAIVEGKSSRIYGVVSYYAAADAVGRGALQASRIVSPEIGRTLVLAQSQKRPATLATREVASLVSSIVQDFIQRAPGS